eukprot:5059748-Pyramimonas_sp.AAC.1
MAAPSIAKRAWTADAHRRSRSWAGHRAAHFNGRCNQCWGAQPKAAETCECRGGQPKAAGTLWMDEQK